MVWPLLRFMAGRSSGFMGYTQAANSTESDGPALPCTYIRMYVYICSITWMPYKIYLLSVHNMFVQSLRYICQNFEMQILSNLQIFEQGLTFCTFEFASCVLELSHIPVSTQILMCKYMMDFVQTIVVCKCQSKKSSFVL